MKNLLIVIAMLVVFGAASLAFAQDMRDSSNWERGFEFTTDPTSGWSNWNGNPGPVTTVAGGVLNFKPTTGWVLWNTNSGSNPLGTGDWSMEWSVAMVSMTGVAPMLYADINSAAENVNFSTGFGNEGTIYGQYSVSPVSPVGSGVMQTAGLWFPDYHKYRLTRTAGTGTPVAPVVGYSLLNMYVDDNPVPIYTLNLAMTAKNSDNMFGFGNGSMTGEFNVDYVRWTTTGAYEVVPEPVTLSLLALGAMGLIRRKK
ncbi:MAG: PEP-CTERM sorting domain-containing protein [Phycisphaerae bacterium]